MIDLALLGGPFDSVFDVGSNLGDFAEAARAAWPDARITSFEAAHLLCDEQRKRAAGRWWVENVAVSDRRGMLTLHYCTNQHTASTLQGQGTVRREQFGIVDRFVDIDAKAAPLDDYLKHADGRLLVKVDVEGHELGVLAGALGVLNYAETVVIEVQNDPNIFLGSAPPERVDAELRRCGLSFAGLAGAFLGAGGRVLQYDAVYRRHLDTA